MHLISHSVLSWEPEGTVKFTFNHNRQSQEIQSFAWGIKGLSRGVPVPVHSPAWGGRQAEQTGLSGFLVFVVAR